MNDDSIHTVGAIDDTVLPSLAVPPVAAKRAALVCDLDPEMQRLRRLQNLRKINRASLGIDSDKDGNVLHVLRASSVIPNSSNGMATFGLALEAQGCKQIIKVNGSGALVSSICNKCNRVSSNHYCRYPVALSGVTIDGSPDNHICGYNECNLCKFKWGNPEDHSNRCVHHKNM